ncbi:MAG: hypothetical protein Q8O56_06285 [Solirubrobacteraceae bacterium]|nr:hypothetical protein [Solirubrobacteraceae bacterium]
MSTERWYAGRWVYDRNHRPRNYVVRLVDQPQGGFADIGDLMRWLEGRGLIRREVDADGDDYLAGWGDPYCAVAASRRDRWEVATQEALDVR